MAKLKYIPLFDDQLEVAAFLSDEQLGCAVRAAMWFMRDGEDRALDGIAGMFYQVLRSQYLRQLRSQQSGMTGGRPKIEKQEEEQKENRENNREEITPLFREETPVSLRGYKVRGNKIRDKDSLSRSSAKPPSLSDDDFESFWKSYPRKDSKTQAKKAFAKVDVPLDRLLQAVEVQKQTEQWRRDGGQFIPYASTWLNQRRWEDEPPAQPEKEAEPAGDWTIAHPDWLDQSTWVPGPDGVYRTAGVLP